MDWIGSCSGSSWGYWMVAVNTLPRAFDILKDSDTREDWLIRMEHGEPVRFGADLGRGLRIGTVYSAACATFMRPAASSTDLTML